MNDSDVTTVGLSEHADDLLDQLKEQEIFAEKTLFNVGSLDPGQLIRSAVEALYEDHVDNASVYRVAERLADWGIRELYEQASEGQIDFAKILKSMDDLSSQ